MARKVNKGFVIGLGAVLLLLAGVVGWVVLSNAMRDQDPEFLAKRAAEAEAAGDIKSAMTFTYKAAEAASKKQTGKADVLFMHLGDLYMSQSAKDPTFFNAARKAWERAQAENPKNMEARQRLLEENYKVAVFYRQPTTWSQLEDAAKKVLALDPNSFKAHIYAAEAIIESVRNSNVAGVIDPRLKEAREHIAVAAKVSPEAPEPTLLSAGVTMVEAARAFQTGNPKLGEELRKKSYELILAYTKKYPTEPTALVRLAMMYMDLRNPDAAMATMDQAYKANPKDPRVVFVYAEIKRPKNPEQALAALKALVEDFPDETDYRFRLANFYQQQRKNAEALVEFKTIVDSTTRATGIQGLKRENWEINSLYNVAWMSMDAAQQSGVSSADGKKSMAQASEYIDRLRKTRPSHPLLDVLDGRMNLMKGNIPQAIVQLKRADVNLGNGEGANPQHWVNVKLKLAEAYKAQMEWGNCLAYLDQIQTRFPKFTPVLLEKAQVLNRIAEYEKALHLAEGVLKDPEEKDNQLAIRILANSYLGLGMMDKYKETMRATTDSPSTLMESAKVQLMTGDPQGALDILERVFKQDPDNLPALNMAAIANIQLDKRDTALALAKRGLEKAPKSTQFQMMVGVLEKPDANPAELQKKVIENIEDEFTRNMSMAAFLGKKGDRKGELESLYAAEKVLDGEGEQGRNQANELVDRIFTVLMNAAATTKDSEEKKQFLNKAQSYVEKAERKNLDGANGKLYLGRLELARGDKKQGIATLEQAVAARPDYSMARTVLGQAYLESGRDDAALGEFQKAIDQKPDNVMALKGAIILLERRGDPASFGQAQNYLKQAVSFAPRDPQLRAFTDAIGNEEEAIRTRTEEFRRNPDDVDNLRRLAFLYVKSGNRMRQEAVQKQNTEVEKRAVEQFKRAAVILKGLSEKNPNDLAIADNLAKMYRETLQPNDALLVYQRFVTSADPLVRYEGLMRMGDMYRSMSQMPEAVATFKNAIAVQPADKDEAERRLADLYFDMDDMKNAEQLYSQVFAKSQKDTRVLRRLVETMIRQEKYVQALEMLETQILAKNPQDEEGLVLKGFAQLRQRKAREALESFNLVLSKSPNNLDALHYRAFSQFYLQGDLEQAARDLIRVREQNKNAINSRLLLARVYRLARRYAEASSEYRDVVSLRPDLMQARIEYADYLLNIAELQTKVPADSSEDWVVSLRSARPAETAQFLLEESVRRFPDQVIWKVMQGNLMALRNNKAGALQMLEEAFKASGENPAAASAYLKALLEARDYEKVIQLTTRLMATRPDYVDYYVKRGTAYGAVQKPELALADFDRALALSSKDLQVFLNVVRQTSSAVQVEPTIVHLTARVKADPSDIPSRVGLAQSLLASGRYSEAYKTIEPLMTDPKAAGLRPMLLRFGALALYQNKEYEKSLALYLELVKLEPEDLEALNNLAFLLAEDLNRPKEAMVHAETAVKILRTRPVDVVYVKNGNLLDTYGWVKFLNGEPDKAIVELKRALAIEPLPITYLHLAKVYKSLKRTDEMNRALKSGVELAAQKKDPVLADLQRFQKEVGG